MAAKTSKKHIDARARRGVILQNYYGHPLCSATRCTLPTGRTPNRHGIHGALKTESRHGLPIDERILPQLLKTAGYITAIMGKWHAGEYQPAYPNPKNLADTERERVKIMLA